MDRRQHTRIPTGSSVPGRLEDKIPVEVTELSMQGISLETVSALKPGSNYRLRLLDGACSELDARVIWCRLDRNEKSTDGSIRTIYRAGLSRLDDRLI